MTIYLAILVCLLLPCVAVGGEKEYVILVHGLGRTALSMKGLEWNLRKAGYTVINLSFPSRHAGIEELAEKHLAPMVATLPQGAKINFVTHSLGGILVRQYLSSHALANLGRVVMLAPPSQGSELPDRLRRSRWGRWILGPAGCDLGTSEADAPQRLGPVKFEVGVIAGDCSLNPFFSRAVTGASDGKVSVARTKLVGMSGFCVIHSSHTWMMWRSHTYQLVRAFLARGSFSIPLAARPIRS